MAVVEQLELQWLGQDIKASIRGKMHGFVSMSYSRKVELCHRCVIERHTLTLRTMSGKGEYGEYGYQCMHFQRVRTGRKRPVIDMLSIAKCSSRTQFESEYLLIFASLPCEVLSLPEV